MKFAIIFSSFVISVILIVTPSTALSQAQNQFEQLLRAKAPIQQIVIEILSSDPQTNFQNLQNVQLHIAQNDEYASYGKALIATGQKILDKLLREINYHQEVNIEKIIVSAYEIASDIPVRDENMANLVHKIVDNLSQSISREGINILVGKLLDGVDTEDEDPAQIQNVSSTKNAKYPIFTPETNQNIQELQIQPETSQVLSEKKND